MKARMAMALCAAALPAWPQIAVYTLDSRGAETAVENLIDVGTAAAGDTLDMRVRLRNTGTSNATLQVLRVLGVGFTVENDPSKPFLMTPGTNVDFRVRFRPAAFGSYSATMLVNERSYLLRGVSPAGATLQDESGTPLHSESLVSFGRVEQGSTGSRRLVLRNETTLPVTVGTVSVSAPPFQGPVGLALPVELAPGASASFEVVFAPARAGIFTGTLTVDGRAIPMEGVGLDPPYPQARIEMEDSALESGRQVKMSIRLASPSPVTGGGTLTMSLRPTVAGVEDAAALFPASGARTVAFTVTKGEDLARVENQTEFYFQTGTTAGELTLELKLGFQQLLLPFRIAPAAVRADSVRVSRTPTGLEAAIEGFDNTRTITHATFTFFDAAGRALGVGPMRVNLAEAFTGWWRQSGFGGAFLLRAAFPVAGDASQITGLSVELENSMGRTSAPRAAF